MSLQFETFGTINAFCNKETAAVAETPKVVWLFIFHFLQEAKTTLLDCGQHRQPWLENWKIAANAARENTSSLTATNTILWSDWNIIGILYPLMDAVVGDCLFFLQQSEMTISFFSEVHFFRIMQRIILYFSHHISPFSRKKNDFSIDLRHLHTSFYEQRRPLHHTVFLPSPPSSPIYKVV